MYQDEDAIELRVGLDLCWIDVEPVTPGRCKEAAGAGVAHQALGPARQFALQTGEQRGAGWACLASLIKTCKLDGVNPLANFADLLTRLVNGCPQKPIDELMPAMELGAATGALNRWHVPKGVEHR